MTMDPIISKSPDVRNPSMFTSSNPSILQRVNKAWDNNSVVSLGAIGLGMGILFTAGPAAVVGTAVVGSVALASMVYHTRNQTDQNQTENTVASEDSDIKTAGKNSRMVTKDASPSFPSEKKDLHQAIKDTKSAPEAASEEETTQGDQFPEIEPSADDPPKKTEDKKTTADEAKTAGGKNEDKDKKADEAPVSPTEPPSKSTSNGAPKTWFQRLFSWGSTTSAPPTASTSVPWYSMLWSRFMALFIRVNVV